MRILHVSHELPPYELAGTAIYTWNIARAQAEDNDVFIFARLQDPRLPAYRVHDEHRDALAIRFVNRADLEWSPFERSYSDPRMARLFDDYVEEVRPDVIHFQHIVGLGHEILGVPRARGIPGVYTLHDFWPTCPMGQRMCYTDHTICDPIDFGKCGPCVFGQGWREIEGRELARLPGGDGSDGRPPTLRQRYRRRVMETPGRFARRPRALLRAFLQTARDRSRRPADTREPFVVNPFERRFHVLRDRLRDMDLLISPSAFLRDMLRRELGIPERQIIHSANGMDFSYVHAHQKTPSPRLRVGYVGSVIRTKGVHILVEGFLRAAESSKELELHVHGAPNRWSEDYLRELRAQVEAHPAGDRVRFHGRFENQRVSEVFRDIDLLVLPSIWFENAPLTLNEAAMSRTPVLVSDRGGMREFVTSSQYGRTFRLGDPAALAEALLAFARDRDSAIPPGGAPPPVKAVRANAAELAAIYTRLRQGTFDAPTLEEQTRTRGGILPAP
jgi:glycosyltransferase involved in cell wall biosynthesis